MSLTILLLAVLSVAAGVQFTRTSTTDSGCDGVREAYERVSFVERAQDVPTAQVYDEAALAVRQSAVEAPPQVAGDLGELAGAYNRLADLLRGFRAGDASTYHVYEDNVAAIETQQVVVDTSLPLVGEWLDNRCR